VDTKIISGFPGIGKSVCAKANPQFLDSDSVAYYWQRNIGGLIEKDGGGKNVRHPDFPANYIHYLKNQMGKVPVIFVSSHKEVLDALVDGEIPFTLIYPASNLLSEYIQRYRVRGSSEKFTNLMWDNWDHLIPELDAQEKCDRIILKTGEYLSDVLSQVRVIQ
jgi:hypothetical protein